MYFPEDLEDSPFNRENPQNFKSPNGLRRRLDYIHSFDCCQPSSDILKSKYPVFILSRAVLMCKWYKNASADLRHINKNLH